MLSKEQLLIRRVEVIAAWPGMKTLCGSGIQVGSVLYEKDFQGNRWFVLDNEGLAAVHWTEVEDFQHLFCKLHWWEDREIADMPAYVYTSGYEDFMETRPRGVYEVARHFEPGQGSTNVLTTTGLMICYSCCQPATKEEYEQFISQKATHA